MDSKTRFWEVDVVRALGLLLMLVQHTVIVWNAITLGIPAAPEWVDNIGLFGGWIFVLLVGVSAYISFMQLSCKASTNAVLYRFTWRGLQLLGWAMIIFVASVLVIPKTPIVFGILHFIGAVVMIAPFLIYLPWLRRAVIVGVPLLTLLLEGIKVASMAYVAVGLYPSYFASLDYWPLIPWLAVPAVGIEIGRTLYPDGTRRFQVPSLTSKPIAAVAWLGRHTLIMYLIHIPVLFVLLSAVQYLVD